MENPIVEISELENCTTCRNSQEGDIQQNLERVYLCIRKPPEIFVIGTAGGFANVTAFPQVTSKMICRKFDVMPMILEETVPAAYEKY